MIASAIPPEIVDGLVVLLGGSGLAVIAWFFRSWASELGTKVDHLSDKVDKLDDKVDNAINELAQVKVVIGWPPQLGSVGRHTR